MSNYNRGSQSQNQNYPYQQQNRGYSGNNAPRKKHSGCKMQNSYVSKATGEVVNAPLITGWNYAKSRGMLSFIATPRKDKKIRETAHPDWENWYVKVFNKRTLQTEHHNGFYQLSKGRLFIKDMVMMLNPKAPNGGYVGTYIRSKN